ncbi:MarR family winged helix-turn-helix transcriptional regulator [Frondihabitans cladoniiphilus]|uniref:HTH marR-type domain-containing protein n=1 Tax=Frondihabitans cladoniiphilus TaxID=715785 RepID=A0ABP8VPQ3_9MICO
MADIDALLPPTRLKSLTQWQAGKVATLGARLTAARIPLGGRADFAVLAALEEYGPLSQADVGRRLGLDRNDVNAVASRLDEAGHVDRRPDPDDRRRNVVTITAGGRRHLDELEEIALGVQDELLLGLQESERRLLRSLLNKVLTNHGPQAS